MLKSLLSTLSSTIPSCDCSDILLQAIEEGEEEGEEREEREEGGGRRRMADVDGERKRGRVVHSPPPSSRNVGNDLTVLGIKDSERTIIMTEDDGGIAGRIPLRVLNILPQRHPLPVPLSQSLTQTKSRTQHNAINSTKRMAVIEFNGKKVLFARHSLEE